MVDLSGYVTLRARPVTLNYTVVTNHGFFRIIGLQKLDLVPGFIKRNENIK